MHDCSRLGRPAHLVTALFIAACVFGCGTTQPPAATGPAVQAAAQPEKAVAPGPVQRPVYQAPGTVAYYPPPARIDFCGEPVPLDSQDVMERFDKEFTLVVYNHAQVYSLLKRKARLFPVFEERLRRLNLPEDLKYVAVAEIVPPPNAPRKRSDLRYDFEISPDGAFQYLGELYRSFRSWSLAVAAYSSGERNIMDQCRAQGVTDCYKMMLPPETERYVFRVLAIKAVLSDPAQYGYEVPKGGYR